ncbi:MAG: DUF420 domain-containing protein [Acidobacteria bacterium]|nr:DUF420 domain-containing protein [Acidobacteriota bacterium]
MTTERTTSIYTAPSTIIAMLILVSALGCAFIFWLIYWHPPIDATAGSFKFLPGLNAIFNGLSSIALITGFVFIMKRNVRAHRASMFTAFVFSSLFLVSYLGNYYLHGEYHLPIAHTGSLWTTYLLLLISHIILSVIALPMILVTFFFSLSERFPQHKKIARYTLPIWLYVSLTGVAVYLIQAAVRG